jgi:hypothetical protein
MPLLGHYPIFAATIRQGLESCTGNLGLDLGLGRRPPGGAYGGISLEIEIIAESE